MEPELEEGETQVAGGGHGDEPGLADAAPSQSEGKGQAEGTC